MVDTFHAGLLTPTETAELGKGGSRGGGCCD